MVRLQNSRIFCECKRHGKIIFKRKVWSECRNGASHASRRFTREDHAYGASRLPKIEENDYFAVYLVVVKQGFICELYARVLQSEKELAVLSRAHCCEINAWKSSLICLPWLPTRSLLQLQNQGSTLTLTRFPLESKFTSWKVKKRK